MRKYLTVLLLAVFFLSSGCRLEYLYHAALGQYRLLNESIPVQAALEKDLLSADQKDRLRLVAKIKAFGENSLGLRKTDCYETVYLASDQQLLYTVSASPKDSLQQKTWDFPIVGKMPYLGFFELEKAREEGRKLSSRNMDVFIGSASAYSTLGWFADPVTKNLLTGSTPILAETILHEMTHATLYAKGQGAFNEGLAVLVGKVGAVLFFEEDFGPSHPFTLEAKATVADERIFSAFMASLMKDLQKIYASPLTYREKMDNRELVFVQALQEFAVLKTSFKTTNFSGFGRIPLNNAYILAVGLYHSRFALFETALRKKDGSIKELMLFFKAAADENKDLLEWTAEWTGASTIHPLSALE